ncbi:MAG: hypothetical protein AAF485_32635 [Chloroflexota bacterium]
MPNKSYTPPNYSNLADLISTQAEQISELEDKLDRLQNENQTLQYQLKARSTALSRLAKRCNSKLYL